MMSNDFEAAFSNFLERREYDEAESALFSIIRAAFLAGWRAAGGEPPTPPRIILTAELYRFSSASTIVPIPRPNHDEMDCLL